MTSHALPRPASDRKRGEILPEFELIKIAGFVIVIACHFWGQHVLPHLLGATQRVTGMGIDASTPSHIDLTAWLPAFSVHEFAYTLFNLGFGFGYQGVGVFFVLTGFGLTLSALQKPKLDPWNYVLGRFERVYLPYLFLLVAYTAFNLWQGGRNHFDLRALVLMDTGIPYAWFMFPLLQFYVVFPFLFLLVKSQRITPAGLLGGAIGVNAVWAFAVLFAAYNFMPALAESGACAPKGLLPFRIAEPVYGMWLAFLYHQHRTRFERWFAPRHWALFAGIYVSGCLLSLAETNLEIAGRIVPLGQSVTNLIVSIGLFGLMVLIARKLMRLVSRTLPLARYGFEFYLLQAIPLAGVAWFLPRISLTPLTIMATLVALLVINFALAIGMQHATQFILRHTYYRLKAWLQFANSATPVAKPVRVPSRDSNPPMPAPSALGR